MLTYAQSNIEVVSKLFRQTDKKNATHSIPLHGVLRSDTVEISNCDFIAASAHEFSIESEDGSPAESVASLNLLESVAVPKKTFPLALKAEPRPVAVEGGALPPVLVGGGGGGGGGGAEAPGWHWE